jgi:hypothetical protein
MTEKELALHFKFIFKALFLAAFLSACTSVERDNILDPKNKNSQRSSVVLMEIFMNASLPAPYDDWNLWTLEAAENTVAEYPENLVLCEYHRTISNADTTYPDSYSDPQFDDLHQIYADYDELGSRSVPDLYLNGAENRILGASSLEGVYTRIGEILPDLLKKVNYYTIEANVEKISAKEYHVDYKIAKLANQSAQNLTVRIILIKNTGIHSKKYTVVGYKDDISIRKISAGGYHSGQAESILTSEEADAAIISISNNEKTNVYQTLKVEI